MVSISFSFSHPILFIIYDLAAIASSHFPVIQCKSGMSFLQCVLKVAKSFADHVAISVSIHISSSDFIFFSLFVSCFPSC